jgi:hypothetical protein
VGRIAEHSFDSLTAAPSVALARIVIGTTEVDDRRRRRAMIDPVNPTDAEQNATRQRMIAVGLKGYVGKLFSEARSLMIAYTAWR